MSKETKKVQERKNPADYVYKQWETVELDGGLLLDLINGLTAKVKEDTEIKVEVIPQKNEDGTINMEAPPQLIQRQFISDFAQWANQVVIHLANVHYKNVESGKAVKKESNRPTFKVEKSAKK